MDNRPAGTSNMSRRRLLTLLVLGFFGLLAAYFYSTQTPTMPAKTSNGDLAKGAIVVGSGLAGLSAASQLISRNIPVRLLERSAKPGGNSIKASSGINGAPTKYQPVTDDAFYSDTVKSAGKAFASVTPLREKLVGTLTKNSSSAISWLVDEKGVDLSRVSQLGGHSLPRTHRGAGQTPPGASIITTLLDSLKASPLFDLQTSSTVTKVLKSGERVTGVQYASQNGEQREAHGPVIFASGGFAGDSEGLLAQYRPDLVGYPSTNDARPGTQPLLTSVGAQLLDMDQVQVHPTGFIDPANPASPVKFLAAEVLRGEGGLLLINGKRFIDELQTRENVTKAITKSYGLSANPRQWDVKLVIDEGTYEAVKSHVDFYIWKGLMKKTTLAELGAEAVHTVHAYGASAYSPNIVDPLKRTVFGSWTLYDGEGEDVVYVGTVTPVVHFTMGGVVINEKSEVLKQDSSPIQGLWAAGEITGGVHGQNRLGGSSLLECVVFGRIAGDQAAEYINKSLK